MCTMSNSIMKNTCEMGTSMFGYGGGTECLQMLPEDKEWWYMNRNTLLVKIGINGDMWLTLI